MYYNSTKIYYYFHMCLQLYNIFFCRKIFILRLFISKIYLAINSMVKRNLSAPFYRPIQLFYRMMWAKKCPKIIPDKSITFGDMVRARRFGYGWWSWESSRWSNIKCPAVNRPILSFSHARHDCMRINVHLSRSYAHFIYACGNEYMYTPNAMP